MNEQIFEFEEEYRKEKPIASYDLGLQEVPLDAISGTVGRYRDFDRGFGGGFHQCDRRASRIAEILSQKKELPPLELYKLKDKYFILDGHHRVLVARRMGIKSLKARVVEFLPPKNSMENILARERSEFELLTGLKDISLTEISQYEKLLNQIREHKYYLSEKLGRETSFRESASDWFDTVYGPIARRISEEEVHKDFPGREIADLYVYISDHKWMASQRRGYDIGFATALEEFLKVTGNKSIKAIIADFFATFWKGSGPLREEFEEQTGLSNIDLSDDALYPRLLKEIEEHKNNLAGTCPEGVPLKEVAFHWRFEVFEPIKKILEEERYIEGFPRKTSADLYLILSELKWLESEKKGHDIGIEGAFEELKKKKEGTRGSLRATIKKLLSRLKSLDFETHGER